MAVRAVEWPRDAAAVARSLALTAEDGGGWFWLDGAAPEPGGERGRGSRLSYLGTAGEVQHARRGAEREFLALLRGSARDWVVALSYEFGVALLDEDPAADDVPPAFALRADAVLVLDHDREEAELRGDSERALDAWLARHGGALSSDPEPGVQGEVVPGVAATWRRSDSDYVAAIEACKEAIRDGDAYVICLTDTAETACGEVDPLSLYLRLRDSGAEIRGGVLVAGSRAVVSASPERFLSVRGRRVATHPIKGTRRRGPTPEQDAALADDLAADAKERAENLMIVDLMRNDLSRVCVPGTVAAEGFLRVESHPRVHQLVSTVAGVLLDDANAFDALEACFPGGSMTGAPKRRAVQLLAGLEAGPRGLYSGCLGWIGASGDVELAMTIRSVELRGLGSDSVRALVGAGGGVTFDSDPAAELAEKNLKAEPLLAALAF